jgi:uncharacterized membrane protein YcjF (UPF0283 family)
MKRKKWNKKGMLGQLIGGFVVILIGVSLMPVISQKVQDVRAQTNAIGIESTALGLIPLIFGVTIILTGIMIAIQSLKSARLDELSPEWVNDKPIKKPRPKKQTYFQYVQERIAIEREMRRADGIFWWLRG